MPPVLPIPVLQGQRLPPAHACGHGASIIASTTIRGIDNPGVMDWIDPISDRRWTEFVERHRRASVFHTVTWLESLRRTYGYGAVALTSSAPGGQLTEGIPFCQVKSWISGSRLVSLPFSDHCQPLVDNGRDFGALLSQLSLRYRRTECKYIEMRAFELPNCGTAGLPSPTYQDQADLNRGNSDVFEIGQYNCHKIDLGSELKTLFSNFHKSCIQRKIERAERERLEYEAGRSELILAKFYHLLLLTRRRHGLPPQPKAWFRNLIDGFGDDLTIRVAAKNQQPIAAMLTLRHKRSLVYKYGVSDAPFHRMGGMPMLFWKAIQEEKLRGAEELDLGRSDITNSGLNQFKEHLGGVPRRLIYVRMGCHRDALIRARPMARVHALFARMPALLAQVAGRLLYKHAG